jgi:hypothetical protein
MVTDRLLIVALRALNKTALAYDETDESWKRAVDMLNEAFLDPGSFGILGGQWSDFQLMYEQARSEAIEVVGSGRDVFPEVKSALYKAVDTYGEAEGLSHKSIQLVEE